MTSEKTALEELPVAQPLPAFWQAAVCFIGILLLIALGLFVFEISLHALIFLALVWAGVHTRILGYSFIAIRSMMDEGIVRALPAIYIFMLIGWSLPASCKVARSRAYCISASTGSTRPCFWLPDSCCAA